MSYTAEHKQATRERIVECARQLLQHKAPIDDVTVVRNDTSEVIQPLLKHRRSILGCLCKQKSFCRTT